LTPSLELMGAELVEMLVAPYTTIKDLVLAIIMD
jgi:hypothetical protein